MNIKLNTLFFYEKYIQKFYSYPFTSCSKKSNQELILGTLNVTSFKENNIERFNQLFTKYTWTFNDLQQVMLFIRYPDNTTDTFTTSYQINEEYLTFQGVQFLLMNLPITL